MRATIFFCPSSYHNGTQKEQYTYTIPQKQLLLPLEPSPPRPAEERLPPPAALSLFPPSTLAGAPASVAVQEVAGGGGGGGGCGYAKKTEKRELPCPQARIRTLKINAALGSPRRSTRRRFSLSPYLRFQCSLGVPSPLLGLFPRQPPYLVELRLRGGSAGGEGLPVHGTFSKGAAKLWDELPRGRNTSASAPTRCSQN